MLPLSAYNVSGEYSAVKAAAANGWLDEPTIVRENLTAIARAGADQIITYHARDALKGKLGCEIADRRARPSAAATGRTTTRGSTAPRRSRPGGVNSPVRAFGSVGGTPLVIRSAAGATIIDVDGREYLDFVGSWGPLILGHAHPKIVAAVEAACRRGMSYGAPSTPEIELAEEVVAAYPGIEQVRFVSSGTEAVMSAVQARARRDGPRPRREVLGLLSRPRRLPARRGGLGPRDVRPAVLQGRAGRARRARRACCRSTTRPRRSACSRQEGDRIAAVIIEPVPANNGLLLQRPDFLQALRALCDRHGALLIFDEVITRLSARPRGRSGALRDHAGPRDVRQGHRRRNARRRVRGQARAHEESVARGRRLPSRHAVGQPGRDDGRARDVAHAAKRGRVATARSARRVSGASRRRGALGRRRSPFGSCRLGSMFWLAWLADDAPRSAEALEPRAADVYARVFHSLLDQGIALAPVGVRDRIPVARAFQARRRPSSRSPARRTPERRDSGTIARGRRRRPR